MLSIRCPECELRLFLEDEEPTDRLNCPGCGTIFQWDKTTGLVTVFYEEKEIAPETDAGETNEPDGNADDTSGEALSPVETMTRINRKWEDRLHEEDRRQKRRFTRPFVVTTLLIIVCVGSVAAISNRGRWWEILIGVVPGALLVGFAVASFLAGIGDLGRYLRRLLLKVLGDRAGEPDLDDIAERLQRGIVRRRPLPSSSDSSENPDENEVGPHLNITPECPPRTNEIKTPVDRTSRDDSIRLPPEPST